MLDKAKSTITRPEISDRNTPWLVSIRVVTDADKAFRQAGLRRGGVKAKFLELAFDEAVLRAVDPQSALLLEKGDSTNTSAKLPLWTIDRIKTIAEEKGISISALINQGMIDKNRPK